ncbi:DoxX family membrane protein [Paenibacillus paeoniae]|uniref:DoxX family membrane protein n=2 Tax=Paenibacillus paeoniae TaxID=2292705 RepID=A0A371P5Y6_9BACL|nr:DoxX family membrane protein [Paenibacillus paeoniae]
MRVLFGLGWLMAGLTKITGKAGEASWYQYPGEFLTDYFHAALLKPNVPEFYKAFIEHFCLNEVLPFNYIIPAVQVIIGVLLILGIWILPSVLICMFMHINFILSGNMNIISLTLYTSAFGIMMNLEKAHMLSLHRLLKSKRSGKQLAAPTLSDVSEEALQPASVSLP